MPWPHGHLHSRPEFSGRSAPACRSRLPLSRGGRTAVVHHPPAPVAMLLGQLETGRADSAMQPQKQEPWLRPHTQHLGHQVTKEDLEALGALTRSRDTPEVYHMELAHSLSGFPGQKSDQQSSDGCLVLRGFPSAARRDSRGSA